MSTFLNRFSNSTTQRIEVSSAFAGTPTFHDGLAYDETTPDLLVVNYAGTAAYFQAGIGFTAIGEMCVVDASAGLPADTFWQSGLPISAAQHRLCVDPTNAVSYVHQGVPFTTVHAVAVDGSVVPPEEQTFDNVRFLLSFGGEPSVADLADIYFGTAGTISGLYTVQATFLSEHPGLTLEDFAGIAAPGGYALVPASFPGSFTSTGTFDTSQIPAGQLIKDSAAAPATAECRLEWGYSGGADPQTIATLTFTPPINSVGFSFFNPQSGTTVEFRDGTTVLASSTVSGTNFLGYSSAAVVPTGDYYEQESGGDVYIQESADAYIQE